MERLTSGYYRQAAAVLHDISTIARNAKEYNGEGTEIAVEAHGRFSSLQNYIWAPCLEPWPFANLAFLKCIPGGHRYCWSLFTPGQGIKLLLSVSLLFSMKLFLGCDRGHFFLVPYICMHLLSGFVFPNVD